MQRTESKSKMYAKVKELQHTSNYATSYTCVKQEKEIACCGVDETYFGRETANHCVLKSIGSPEIVSDDCIAGRVCYCYPNVPPSSALEVCPYNKGIYDGGGGGWESGENKTCSLVEG